MAYHSALISGLAMGYAEQGKKLLKGATPQFDFNACDVVMAVLDVGLALATKDMLIKQGIIPADILKQTLSLSHSKMATIAMLLGGTLVNSLAFTGSNVPFSPFRNKDVGEERKRHDKAVEQLQATQVAWAHKRLKRLEWINEELRRQGHAVHTFQGMDEATRQYHCLVTGKVIAPDEPKPTLSDFYVPSDGQYGHEVAFVVLGLGATASPSNLVTVSPARLEY